MSDDNNVNGAAPASEAPSALDVGSESIEGSQVEGQEAEAVEPPPAEIKRLNKLKLKVNGQEMEEELPFDFNDSPEAVEYLTKQLQLSKAAQRAMQDKSTYEKQVAQFFQSLKGNTKQALQEMGIDPKEFAASVIEEEIKKAQLSPEQRKQQELEDKIRELEKQREDEKEELTRKEMEQLQKMEFERIESQMSSAIEKSDLPKEPYIIRRIAEYMLIGAKNRIDLTPDDVIPLVREELLRDMNKIINSLPEDKAEEFIGKEVLNRFRKKNLAKAKQTGATVKAGIKDVGTKPAASNQPEQKVNYKEFFKF